MHYTPVVHLKGSPDATFEGRRAEEVLAVLRGILHQVVEDEQDPPNVKDEEVVRVEKEGGAPGQLSVDLGHLSNQILDLGLTHVQAQSVRREDVVRLHRVGAEDHLEQRQVGRVCEQREETRQCQSTERFDQSREKEDGRGGEGLTCVKTWVLSFL